MKILATIEARMSSSYLPEKVQLPGLGNSMLHHFVQRLLAVLSIAHIILTPTANAIDDTLFSCHSVVNLLKQNPAWVDINRAVVRKGDT